MSIGCFTDKGTCPTLRAREQAGLWAISGKYNRNEECQSESRAHYHCTVSHPVDVAGF